MKYIQFKTIRAELPFLFLSNEEREKLRLNRVNPLKSPKLELLSYSLSSNWFAESEHPFTQVAFTARTRCPSTVLAWH